MENIDPVGHSTLETMSFAKWYNTWIFDLITPYLGKTTLEVGSGIGNFLPYLERVSRVVATDINPSYLKQLEKIKLKMTRVGYGDLEKKTFFFGKETFNSLVCLNVLEHINPDLLALRNASKLLKKEGYLVLLVPAHKELFSDFDKGLGHFRRYSISELDKKLTKSGFESVKINYLNWWGAVGWLFFMKILKRPNIPPLSVRIFDIFGKLFLLPERFIKLPFGLSVIAIAKRL